MKRHTKVEKFFESSTRPYGEKNFSAFVCRVRRFIARSRLQLRNLALTLLLIGLSIPAFAGLRPHFVINSDGISFPDTPDFSIQYSFFTELDTSYFSNNPLNVKGDTNVRQIETWESITWGQNWHLYFSQRWFNSEKLHNALLTYTRKYYTLSAGQVAPLFGLNNTNTEAGLMFPEYNLPDNALSPPSTLGLFPSLNGDHWALQLSATSFQLAKSYKKPAPFGLIERFFIAPYHTDHDALDIGFSYWYQKPDGSHQFDAGTIPEATTASQPNFVNTGTINNVQQFGVGDAEFGIEHHAFSFQTEYLFSNVARNRGQPNLVFRGYYLMSGYYLTGESETYHFPTGYFTGPSKLNHSYGAVQLAGRISEIDLDSHDIQGGKELNATLGVNWYITTKTVLRFNFIHVWNEIPTTNQRKNFNIALLRLQTGIY